MNAIVTGASSGIGRAIARQLADRGLTVVCCARSKEKLQELQAETSGLCLPLVVDLSRPNASSEVVEFCAGEQLEIDILVNCAGYGAVGHHVRHSAEELAQMCRLNVNTPSELCAVFGRQMRTRRRGFILNVSSVAGFMPIPFFANYSASKAFLCSLTDSLHEELRLFGVNVCCLSPGPVRTNFHARSNPNYSNDEQSFFSLSAEEVAEAGLRGLFEGRRQVVPGFANRCSIWLTRLLPRSLVSRFLAGKSESRDLTD